MQIIEQSYEIIDLSPDAMKKIERIGRVCWKSEDRITETSAGPFVSRMINHVTESVLEHSIMTVRFVTNRGVTHELARHRISSPSQESTRYCDYQGREMQFILPVWAPTKLIGVYPHSDNRLEVSSTINWTDVRWLRACYEDEAHYKALRALGQKPEQAREVLPNSLKTEYILTANMREWRHIFRLRCASKAHPQMRGLMRPLLEEVHSQMPELFEDVWYDMIGHKIDEQAGKDDGKAFTTGNPNLELPPA